MPKAILAALTLLLLAACAADNGPVLREVVHAPAASGG